MCVCVCVCVPEAIIAAGDDERAVSVEVNLKNIKAGTEVRGHSTM